MVCSIVRARSLQNESAMSARNLCEDAKRKGGPGRELPTILTRVKQPRERFTPDAKALRGFKNRHRKRLACSAAPRTRGAKAGTAAARAHLQVCFFKGGKGGRYWDPSNGRRDPRGRPVAGKTLGPTPNAAWARGPWKPGNRAGLGGWKLLGGDIGERGGRVSSPEKIPAEEKRRSASSGLRS